MSMSWHIRTGKRGTGSLEQTPCGATVHDDETRNSGTTRALLRAFRPLMKVGETAVKLKRVDRRTGYKPPASRLTSSYGALENRRGQSRNSLLLRRLYCISVATSSTVSSLSNSMDEHTHPSGVRLHGRRPPGASCPTSGFAGEVQNVNMQHACLTRRRHG